jgi:hypothetical protein
MHAVYVIRCTISQRSFIVLQKVQILVSHTEHVAVWKLTLNIHIAAVEAWHAWATILPRDQACSVHKSFLSTTYCTNGEDVEVSVGSGATECTRRELMDGRKYSRDNLSFDLLTACICFCVYLNLIHLCLSLRYHIQCVIRMVLQRIHTGLAKMS